MTTTKTKQVISQAEYEKRVEIEAQNLIYFERMPREKAVSNAREYVNTKFQVA